MILMVIKKHMKSSVVSKSLLKITKTKNMFSEAFKNHRESKNDFNGTLKNTHSFSRIQWPPF